MPHIEERNPDSGAVQLRDAVTVAFFLPMPLHEVIQGVLRAFESYLRAVPSHALRWASIGASSEEWKLISKTTIERCKRQLAPPAAEKRKLTSFELVDGETAADAPQYGFIAIGGPYDSSSPDERNLVQMHFPTHAIEPQNVDAFVDDIRHLAAMVPYVSGYASPGLQISELYQAQAFADARRLATRYAGYDVQCNKLGRIDIDTRVRGARWLTFLGNEITETLGGSVALRTVLPEPIAIEQVGSGLMIRAGKCPELGDTNRRVGTPLLSSVAHALEPVTLFNEPVLLATDFAEDDEEFLQRWERRFLD